MAIRYRRLRLKYNNSNMHSIFIVALVLGLFLHGACIPAENTSKNYTNEQVVELAQIYSPDCRVLNPGEKVSP